MTTDIQDSNRNSQDTYPLNGLEKHLLNDFQYEFPLVSRPYQQIAEKLGTSEQVIIDSLKQLQEQGFVSRVGAVFRTNSIGASTLAAMSVPDNQLESVATMISDYSEVNHNYQREHHFNLWFVVTASDEHALNTILDDIEQRSELQVMYLPMLEDYHIDLGFDLTWT
ncbi:MAG TPA: Lrp/AsnC family transcriptional regulator [Gammaproteobacteria bacterium]|nr:Lrp/AsnC family transcriptional regulator [Gammaproteobacteria bacterium]